MTGGYLETKSKDFKKLLNLGFFDKNHRSGTKYVNVEQERLLAHADIVPLVLQALLSSQVGMGFQGEPASHHRTRALQSDQSLLMIVLIQTHNLQKPTVTKTFQSLSHMQLAYCKHFSYRTTVQEVWRRNRTRTVPTRTGVIAPTSNHLMQAPMRTATQDRSPAWADASSNTVSMLRVSIKTTNLLLRTVPERPQRKNQIRPPTLTQTMLRKSLHIRHVGRWVAAVLTPNLQPIQSRVVPLVLWHSIPFPTTQTRVLRRIISASDGTTSLDITGCCNYGGEESIVLPKLPEQVVIKRIGQLITITCGQL